MFQHSCEPHDGGIERWRLWLYIRRMSRYQCKSPAESVLTVADFLAGCCFIPGISHVAVHWPILLTIQPSVQPSQQAITNIPAGTGQSLWRITRHPSLPSDIQRTDWNIPPSVSENFHSQSPCQKNLYDLRNVLIKVQMIPSRIKMPSVCHQPHAVHHLSEVSMFQTCSKCPTIIYTDAFLATFYCRL